MPTLPVPLAKFGFLLTDEFCQKAATQRINVSKIEMLDLKYSIASFTETALGQDPRQPRFLSGFLSDRVDCNQYSITAGSCTEAKQSVNIGEAFAKGGLAMYPLLLLSVLSLMVIIERIWFWWKLLSRERETSGRVLEAARRDWNAASDLASKSTDQPIGRFLNAALALQNPEPEVFQLALEASAEEELAAMRRGDKVLEATIALAPLLGLLGTVLGLISSLSDIRLGDLGTGATEGVTLGISEALISTATGLLVAIISLAFYRVFQGLVSGQVKIFQRAGNELELLYRTDWAKGKANLNTVDPGAEAASGSGTPTP